jgi:hypothetical protein
MSAETAPITPDRILQLAFGFMASKTLLTAVELGLFSELAQGPLAAETLRDRLGLNPRSAVDFFDALVALGMLVRNDGRYANSPESDLFLDRAKPSYAGGLLEMFSARLYGFWDALPEALRTGQLQNEARAGGDFFAALYADPARLAGFAHAMTGISAGPAHAIARQFPWGKYQSFVDIGTAEGGLAVVVAQAHPHLSGIGFDLPRSARSSASTWRPPGCRTACGSRPAISSETPYRAGTSSLWATSSMTGGSTKSGGCSRRRMRRCPRAARWWCTTRSSTMIAARTPWACS